MILQEQIALFSLVFLPLLASVFIMLIPSVDTEAKKTLSKFFALIELIIFLYVFYMLFKKNILATTAIKFDFIDISINFYLQINKYNIFIYLISTAFLVLNTFFTDDNNSNKSKESFLFLFSFILNIIIGQNDIKIALPVVSLSSFIIFFIIALNNYGLRGSVIFKVGMFLTCCDSICLIMIQTKNSFIIDNTIITFIILLTPALSRMSLPMFLPFIKQLYLSCEEESCILISFLQILGFFLLLLIYNEINFSFGLSLIIIIMILLGVIYLFFLLLKEKNNEFINYYLFLIHSSLSASLMFISKNDIYAKLSIMLCVCNILSYTISFYIYKKSQYFLNANFADVITKLSYLLLLGLPGIGIGCSIWTIVWYLLNYNENLLINYAIMPMIMISITSSFVCVFNNIYNKKYYKNNHNFTTFDSGKNYVLLFVFGLIINAVIPFLMIYKFRG